jgi:hypothetical protein
MSVPSTYSAGVSGATRTESQPTIVLVWLRKVAAEPMSVEEMDGLEATTRYATDMT